MKFILLLQLLLLVPLSAAKIWTPSWKEFKHHEVSELLDIAYSGTPYVYESYSIKIFDSEADAAAFSSSVERFLNQEALADGRFKVSYVTQFDLRPLFEGTLGDEWSDRYHQFALYQVLWRVFTWTDYIDNGVYYRVQHDVFFK